jgi:hypothetical protein
MTMQQPAVPLLLASGPPLSAVNLVTLDRDRNKKWMDIFAFQNFASPTMANPR